jgi:hypothetical protein
VDDLFFNEREADKEVIGSLLNTNLILWRELEASRSMVKSLEKQIKQGPDMKIVRDLNGAYLVAKEYIELTEQLAKEIIHEAKEHAKKAEHDIAMAEKFLQDEGLS